MKLINRPRGCGKTTEAINVLGVNPRAVLLVCTRESASYLQTQYPQYGNRIMYWNDWRRNHQHRADQSDLVVDDADWFLEIILGKKPVAMTMTITDMDGDCAEICRKMFTDEELAQHKAVLGAEAFAQQYMCEPLENEHEA